jgi:hypothetical protein
VAHTCNPSYLRGRDQEDHGLRPAWVNSLWDLILKITQHKKRTGGVAQVVECLKLISNPSTNKQTQQQQKNPGEDAGKKGAVYTVGGNVN